jgi:hypothetical protein
MIEVIHLTTGEPIAAHRASVKKDNAHKVGNFPYGKGVVPTRDAGR